MTNITPELLLDLAERQERVALSLANIAANPKPAPGAHTLKYDGERDVTLVEGPVADMAVKLAEVSVNMLGLVDETTIALRSAAEKLRAPRSASLLQVGRAVADVWQASDELRQAKRQLSLPKMWKTFWALRRARNQLKQALAKDIPK